MSDANAYYQSLLQQGYDVNQAAVYTKEHYPDFVALGAAPAPPPAAPAAPAAPAQSSLDPNMMAMMMMQQQSQQAMMQQQTMLAQSQQSQPAAGVPQTIVVHAGGGMASVPAKDANTGYLLWCCCFLMLCGVHRFYYNRPMSGIVYLFTFGLFGFGQLYDLLIMRELARTA